MLHFKIEQIAIFPKDPAAALELLTALGAADWARDHVVASGTVFGVEGSNAADLAFNYDLGAGKEFEVLHYTEGNNWMKGRENSVSHLGQHCSEEELDEFKEFFAARGIEIAQEVRTSEHSNPVIAGKRWYHYCIFSTREILGCDLKFIIRRDEK